jgi:hypothetical protein
MVVFSLGSFEQAWPGSSVGKSTGFAPAFRFARRALRYHIASLNAGCILRAAPLLLRRAQNTPSVRAGRMIVRGIVKAPTEVNRQP